MSASVRFRFINWLLRIRDQPAKDAVQHYGRSEVHSQSGADVGFAGGTAIHDRLSEGQINGSIELPELCEEVDKFNAGAGVGNHPDLVAYLEGFPAPHNYFADDSLSALVGQNDPSVNERMNSMSALYSGVQQQLAVLKDYYSCQQQFAPSPYPDITEGQS